MTGVYRRTVFQVLIVLLGFYSTTVKSESIFRINAEDPCLPSRYQSNSILDLRLVKIACESGSCVPFDKSFPISASAWRKGGVIATANVEMKELESHFSEDPVAMDSLLMELRVCDPAKGSSGSLCGANSQQLIRMKGAYLLSMSTSTNTNKQSLSFEVWVDPKQLASVNTPPSCPKY